MMMYQYDGDDNNNNRYWIRFEQWKSGHWFQLFVLFGEWMTTTALKEREEGERTSYELTGVETSIF